MFIDIFYWHKVLGYSSQLHKNNKKMHYKKISILKVFIKKCVSFECGN